MRKKIVALTLLLSVFLTGCNGSVGRAFGEALAQNTDKSQSSESNTYELPYTDITITLPGNWEVVEGSNFDMKFTDGEAYISIYAYRYIDLADGWEAYDVYDAQTEELLSKRDNVEQVGESNVEFYDDKTVLTELWSAQRDGAKNYYYSALIEFPSKDQGCAWILFNGWPSYILENLDEMDEILASAKCEVTSN